MKKYKKKFAVNVLEDQALIERCLKNDEQAFEILVKKYKETVYHLALKFVKSEQDAEDLTIQSFQKAFSKLDKFKNEYIFSSWLFKIATNNAIDFLRKKKVLIVSLSSTDKVVDEKKKYIITNLKDKKLNYLEQIIKSEKENQLRKYIDQLPEKYRIVVHMRYYESIPYAEISKKLSIPLGTVKAQLYRAKEILINLIKHAKNR